MRKSFWLPPVLGMVAGLVLLLASAGGWVDVVEERDVGGVAVTEPRSVPGTTYAPAAVAIGLGVVAAGALLAVARGALRRLLGMMLLCAGPGALVVLLLGLTRAMAAEGALTPAPFLAAAAGVAVLCAGLSAAFGPRRPPPKSRYRVESEQPGDDEWTLAAGDGEPRE